MSPYRAHFRCIAGCHGEYALDEIIFRCPKCQNLLEVHHDLTALKQRSGLEWTRLFDDRYLKTSWPTGSGVWASASGCTRTSATRTWSRCTRAAPTCSGPSATARTW